MTDRRPIEGATLTTIQAGPTATTAPGVPSRADSRASIPRWTLLVLAVAGQAALAVAMKSVPSLGIVQAAGVMAVGLYAIGRRNLVLLTCLCAYLTGAEVLWRQTQVPLPYLMAPYALIALSLFVVVVLGRLGRDARIAFFYFLLLVPSTVNTVRGAGGGSRELIAFALSGPLALAAFVAFTSQMKTTRAVYQRILWTVLVSAVGPLAVAVTDIRSYLAEAGSIEFSKQSNFVTSGGFGPVQVSTVLGLGVVVAVVLTIMEPQRPAKIVAGLLAVGFSVQSLLTFSRGGMFSAAIALSALAIAQARNRRIRNRIIVVVGLALTLGYFFVVPWLNDFTGGAFEERFSDTRSGRTELAANDLTIFTRDPVFGVGPGMTKYQRLGYGICQLRSDDCRDEASSHTEFTRMLGEHGIPGAIAIGALAALALRALRSSSKDRPFAVVFVVWAVSQMFYANLRVVAIPFAFGLAFLTLQDPDEPDDEMADEPPGDDRAPRPEQNGRAPHATQTAPVRTLWAE